MIKYSVGLDVSSKDVKACISSIDLKQHVKVHSTKTCTNNQAGLASLIKWIDKHHKQKKLPLFVCMEATGVYHELFAFGLFDNGFCISIIVPNKAKKYLQFLGHKSKNDKIDAKGLARMACEQELKLWSPAAKFYYLLRTFTRYHQSLQEQKTILKGKLHAANASAHTQTYVVDQLLAQANLIDQQITNVLIKINKHLQTNPEVLQKVEQITVIKGVATLTVSVIIAETFGFELFENAKQLISYAGYDVVENQSGSRRGKTKISKKGNSRIRRILHMPAFNTVRWKQGNFVALFDRLVPKHNIKMKAYVAVQKKILTTIYALWKSNKAYDPEFHSSKNISELEQEISSSVEYEKIVLIN